MRFSLRQLLSIVSLKHVQRVQETGRDSRAYLRCQSYKQFQTFFLTQFTTSLVIETILVKLPKLVVFSRAIVMSNFDKIRNLFTGINRAALQLDFRFYVTDARLFTELGSCL